MTILYWKLIFESKQAETNMVNSNYKLCKPTQYRAYAKIYEEFYDVPNNYISFW